MEDWQTGRLADYDTTLTHSIAVALIVAVPLCAAAQETQVDPARDAALLATISAFLDDTLNPTQLESELREYSRAFEIKPYKVGIAEIDWKKIPQERLFAFARVTARITAPTQQAYMKGELTAGEAALKMAPFFLMWQGYGIDPPSDDPAARARIDALLVEIGKFR